MDDAQDMTRRTIPVPDMGSIPSERRPSTPLAALMEAAPNEPLQESQEELEERMELWIEPLAGALDQLEERERYIVEAIVIRNRSYRAVAKELGLTVSTVHQLLHGREDGMFPAEGALPKLKKYIERATEVEL